MKMSVLISIALVGMGLAATLGLHGPTLSHDLALALEPAVQPFTELYFKDLRTLPTAAPAGKPAALSFVIANHEGRVVTYHYKVTVTENGSLRQSVTHTAVLVSGQTIAIPVSFTPSASGKTTQITVELPDQNQAINLRSAS